MVLAVTAPGHPGSDAVGIPNHTFGTVDCHLDIIAQKLAALDVACIRSRGAPVVTPPAAVDLEDAIVGGSVSVVVDGIGVVVRLPLGQTNPVGQAVAVVAVHAITFQHSGPITALVDFGTGHSHQKQKHQTPHDELSDGQNVYTAAAGRSFIVG